MKLTHFPQPYHLVDPSPWPIMTSFSLLITTIGAVLKFQGFNAICLTIGIITLLSCMILWWKDVITESTFLGHHTLKVQNGIKIGFIIFLFSEVFLFFSLFWAYFHSALAPSVELGSSWPPIGIESINPFGLPLLNTIILLSSGATVTWAHYALIEGNKSSLVISLSLTIILASIFTGFQVFEYYYAPFTFADGIYGNTFYALTGLHAIHVLMGNTFLIIALNRVLANHFTDTHHIGMELGIIYWHFVD